jgi:hypothetical protein
MKPPLARRCAWALAVAAALTPTVAKAHPIHTTYAEVRVSGERATITVRAFADDFAAAVARFNGRAVPRDSSAPAADVARYVGAMLQVQEPGNPAVAVVPCGVRRAETLTYACVQLPWRRGLRVTNRLLTDLHPDQVNVLQQPGGPTWLFTRSEPSRVILP